MRRRTAQSNPALESYGLVETLIIGGQVIHDDLAALITGLVEYTWQYRKLFPAFGFGTLCVINYYQAPPGHFENANFWLALVMAALAIYWGHKVFVND